MLYDNQKIDELLRAGFEVDKRQLQTSMELSAGYNRENETWEFIFQYSGNIDELIVKYRDMRLKTFLLGFGMGIGNRQQILTLSLEPKIIYIEKSKRMYYQLETAKEVSCFDGLDYALDRGDTNLTGKGIIVAIIDTGLDVINPQFIDSEGNSRIIGVYDQTSEQILTREEIRRYVKTKTDVSVFGDDGADKSNLKNTELVDSNKIVFNNMTADMSVGKDFIGHGTDVATIACGNSGCAPGSDVLIVKLGDSVNNSFPRTAQVMEAVDFCIKKSLEEQKPIAINLSFGSNYGDHAGNSILERFLNQCVLSYRCCICVGAGNEGVGATHFGGWLDKNVSYTDIELRVGEYELSLEIQLWTGVRNDFNVNIITPTGRVIRDNMPSELLIIYGEPKPYNENKEVYINIFPRKDSEGKETFLEAGVYIIRLIHRRIESSRVDLWLPSVKAIGEYTGFLRPDGEFSYTIPSTASQVITVGAYNPRTLGVSTFSGRGFAYGVGPVRGVKPELVAPGENVLLTTEDYTGRKRIRVVNGTSFSTPFVTGATALLMEWGIVKGNDSFMYANKVKAYLEKGAIQFSGMGDGVNELTGFGRLCVRNSLPKV